MRCSFCHKPGAYAFNGFMICPSCARESTLSLAGERGEIHATLDWRGGGHYLYTASVADADQAGQMKRLHIHQKTLRLIAAAGK